MNEWLGAAWHVLLYAGVAYCVVDLGLLIWLGRCVLPGLRCTFCRAGRPHGPTHR